MKKSLPFACLLALIIFPAFTFAQPFVDILNVKGQYFNQQKINDDAKGKMNETQFEGSFLLPIEQKNGDVVLAGGNAYAINFNYKGNKNISTSLYSASLQLGYQKVSKNKKWKTMVLAIPKINANHLKLSPDNFQMGGIALVTYKKKENLKYDFGIYYNREFYGDMIVPLIGIDWKINDRMNLFGDLPANFNFEYKLNNNFYVGASYLNITSSYRISDGTGDTYVRDGDKVFGHNQLKAYLNYYPIKNVVCYVEGGQTFGRIYQLYNANNELLATNPVYSHPSNCMFFNVGLAYRFRLDVQ